MNAESFWMVVIIAIFLVVGSMDYQDAVREQDARAYHYTHVNGGDYEPQP